MTVDDGVSLRICACVCVYVRVKGECGRQLGQFATQRGHWRSGWVGNDIRCHAPQQQVPWLCHLLPPRCVNDINTTHWLIIDHQSPALHCPAMRGARGYGGDVLLKQADGFGKENDTTS